MNVKKANILKPYEVNEMELDVTQEQLDEFEGPRHYRRKIQEIFPNLNSTEREFLLTGMNEEQQTELYTHLKNIL